MTASPSSTATLGPRRRPRRPSSARASGERLRGDGDLLAPGPCSHPRPVTESACGQSRGCSAPRVPHRHTGVNTSITRHRVRGVPTWPHALAGLLADGLVMLLDPDPIAEAMVRGRSPAAGWPAMGACARVPCGCPPPSSSLCAAGLWMTSTRSVVWRCPTSNLPADCPTAPRARLPFGRGQHVQLGQRVTLPAAVDD